jgi:methylated-DNA-[protein]-cysteine S-methyltransferase
MKSTSGALMYTAIDSPIGPLLVAATTRGVVRIHLGGGEASFVRGLQREHGVLAERNDRALSSVRSALRDYFSGRTLGLDFAADLSALPDFQRRVLEALRQVPYGTVVSYGELARRVGEPGAARAVGQAMGSNPLPLLYPCHRVVAHDGSLGGFAGGLPMKRALLELEGALLPLSERVGDRAAARVQRSRAQARPKSRRTASRA